VRVLLVSHRFPPAHTAGTEVYTEELAVHLAAAGHDVHVFTAEKDVGRRDLTLHRREHRGLPVHELVQNMYLHHFRDTWDNSRVDALFGEVLDEVRPDVVHVHHLLYLSVGIVAAVKARGLRLVMTLHDFWLECPRFGQLVHADGALCHEVEPARCGTCLPSFPWRQSDLARTVGRVLAGVNAVTGIDLSGVARGAGQGDAAAGYALPSAEDAHYYQVQVEARDRALRERLVEGVDQFLAPSRFLADRLTRWGIPAERIEVLPSGVDRARFGQRPRAPRQDRLRVRFLGTQVHLKGAHVLLDAWGRLTPIQRERASLQLNGPDQFQPEYVESLRAGAARVGAVVGGALDREGVAESLAATDLLVVPSLWFENRPLVILEALASRTPLCVSDLGGLVELVEDGDAGWRFPVGNAGALASRRADLIDDPGPLDQLPFARADALLPSWADVAAAHTERYRP
jgi:glycosyltransferase involved in cell wall biosynthesis